MYKAHLHQPLNTFFELNVAGLNRIYRYPQIPIEFEVTFTTVGALGNFTFSLFDDSGFAVEPYLWRALYGGGGGTGYGPNLTFRWGYTAQELKQSEPINGTFTHYNNAVGRNSFVITLSGTVTYATPITASNQYNNVTAMEALTKYTDLHEIKLIVDPPICQMTLLSLSIHK